MRRLSLFGCAALVAVCSATAFGQVKISQVFGGGGNIGSIWARDYVELHNPGAAPFDVTGWSVQYASSTGTTWSVTALSGMIPAHGYYLVGLGSGTAGLAADIPAPDASGTSAMSATDGKVALCNSTTALTGSMPTSAAIVDFIGYGSANWREPFVGGTSANNAPSLLSGVVFAEFRRGCGATDTDNNAADFAIGFPSPRNTATAPANTGSGLNGIGFASPNILEELQTTKLVVTPRACSSDGPALGVTCTADLSSLGGAAGTPLVDDGTSGDEVAGDGMYSLDIVVGAGSTVGTHNVPLTFTNGLDSGGCYVPVRVAATSTPDNDNCSTALAVSVPSVTPFDLTGLNVEYNPISSTSGWTGGLGNSSRRGLWYTVIGTGNTMVATTCGTSPSLDTVINVFCGTCDGLTVVASNDDAGSTFCPASTLAARASWCSTAGQLYYVNLLPFSTSATLTSTGMLDVSDDATPCVGQVPCTNCPAPSPIGAIVEDERGFGPGINDGCDNTTVALQDIPGLLPETIVGTARGYYNGRDVDWYRFQATATGTVTATLNAQFQGVVGLYDLGPGGACPATLVDQSASSDRCANTSASAFYISGDWVGVRVLHAPTPTVFGGVAPGGTSYHYSVGLTFMAGAPNNDCPNADPLAISASYTSGSTEGSTNDGSSSCDAIGRDVWYTITTPADGDLSVDTCGSSIDTVVTLYSGACGSLSEIVCNDDCGGAPCAGTDSCLMAPGLSAGTYLLRVSDKGLGLGGAFMVRATFLVANDDCAGAVEIFEGENGPFDNSLATDSATFMTPAACQAGTGHPGAKDVFFKYTAICDGTVDMQTCNPPGFTATNTDTQLMIYPITDCPSPGLPIACDDDGCTTPTFNSIVTGVPVTGGQMYLVRVSSWGTGSGTFKITVTRHTAAFSTIGPGCSDGGGPGPTLTIDGPPVLGSLRTLSVAGAIPFSPGIIFMSNPGPSSALPGGCTMYLLNSALVFLGYMATDGTGSWSTPVPVPSDSWLECATVTVQIFILPAAPPPFYQVTDGLSVTLGY